MCTGVIRRVYVRFCMWCYYWLCVCHRFNRMKYIRRYLQEVDVIERTETIVKFKNEWGSLCIMTIKQFEGLYEEKSDEW